MRAAKDITGTRFGNLVALNFARWQIRKGKQKSRMAVWLFRCDCGQEAELLAQEVKADYHSGVCPECVKLRKADRMRTHGKTGSRLHNIWVGIRQRCNNPKDTNYRHYGGRGITIAPLWGEFLQFERWALANGYSDHLELDRVDNNGPYSEENCRWITHKENTRRTRRSRLVPFRGKTLCVAEISEATGIPATSIHNRLRLGQSADTAINELRGTK